MCNSPCKASVTDSCLVVAWVLLTGAWPSLPSHRDFRNQPLVQAESEVHTCMGVWGGGQTPVHTRCGQHEALQSLSLSQARVILVSTLASTQIGVVIHPNLGHSVAGNFHPAVSLILQNKGTAKDLELKSC